jgi:hypothetical protein
MLIFAISIIFSYKIKHTSALILLSIIAIILHMVLLYLLLPVGWSADQRIYFIEIMKNSGRIEALENFPKEGLYYVRCPIAWLIALITEIVSAVGIQASWLILISTVYLSYLIFLMLTYYVFTGEKSLEDIAWFILLIEITIYLHSPFLNLISSSIGVLSFIMVLYLFLSHHHKKLTQLLLIIMTSLFVAHGLSIYFSTFLLLLASLSYIMICKRSEEAQRAMNLATLIFVGTWLYQVGVQLIDSIVKEVPYRLDQVLNVLLSQNLFERPLTPSVMEQNLRVVYEFDHIIFIIAYAFPAFLSIISSLFFFYRFLSLRDTSIRHITLMFFSIFSSLSFLIAGFFGWKGIENYVARYMYVYVSPLSVLANASLLNYISKDKKHSFLKVVIYLFLTIIGVISLTENFFTPYASVLKIPDSWKFKKLYYNYYAPSEFNRNLIRNIFLADTLEILSQKKIYLYRFTSNFDVQRSMHTSLIYSNGIYCVLHTRV